MIRNSSHRPAGGFETPWNTGAFGMMEHGMMSRDGNLHIAMGIIKLKQRGENHKRPGGDVGDHSEEHIS